MQEVDDKFCRRGRITTPIIGPNVASPPKAKTGI